MCVKFTSADWSDANFCPSSNISLHKLLHNFSSNSLMLSIVIPCFGSKTSCSIFISSSVSFSMRLCGVGVCCTLIPVFFAIVGLIWHLVKL